MQSDKFFGSTAGLVGDDFFAPIEGANLQSFSRAGYFLLAELHPPMAGVIFRFVTSAHLDALPSFPSAHCSALEWPSNTWIPQKRYLESSGRKQSIPAGLIASIVRTPQRC